MKCEICRKKVVRRNSFDEWFFMMTTGKTVTRMSGNAVVTHTCRRCKKA